MNNQEILSAVKSKKDFSELPEKDILVAYGHFAKRQTSEEEKIRLTRDLLHKVFGAFGSKKLLSPKDKPVEWILRKHISTRERLDYYKDVYKKILGGLAKKVSVVDLGCGANGFSYDFFKKSGFDVEYFGVEAVGQLVDLTNNYFKKNKTNGSVEHLSLFDLEKLKRLIKGKEKPRVIFLFKTLDSLEMLERNYSFKLLEEISKITDRVCVSFATRSLVSREKFAAKRTWLTSFITQNFKTINDFEIGGERYIVFEKK